jgi:hypothetical protein
MKFHISKLNLNIIVQIKIRKVQCALEVHCGDDGSVDWPPENGVLPILQSPTGLKPTDSRKVALLAGCSDENST